MNKVRLCYSIMLTVLVTSCEFHCSVGGSDSGKNSKSANYADNPAFKGAIISNDVELEGGGVKLKQAYLMDKDEKRLTENEVKVGEHIYLVLETDTGWTKIDGRSFVGAAEKIVTSKGKTIAESEDIFKNDEANGYSAADAGYIRLSAVITEADPGVEDFVVHFRVWDKKGPGEIKGQYKFHIKN